MWNNNRSSLSSSITNLKSSNKLKPTMSIRMNPVDQSDGDEFDKQEIASLKAQIKALEKHKSKLTPDTALEHMHTALDSELMQKKGRQMQLQGRLKVK